MRSLGIHRAALEATEMSSRALKAAPVTNAKLETVLRLQRMVGNHAMQRWLRTTQGTIATAPQLSVSMPDDLNEVQAERIADEVMRMPDTEGPGSLQGANILLDRASACSGEAASEKGKLHRQAVSPSPAGLNIARTRSLWDVADSITPEEMPQAGPQPEEPIARKAAKEPTTGEPGDCDVDLAGAIDQSCRHAGQPLPSEAREFMESRFGQDFGKVRIHADPWAGHLARQVQARAFTTTNHIFFAPGEFQPDHTTGKHLLAHELAHVVQQSGSDHAMARQIQRLGNGGLNCPRYAGYETPRDLATYNCAGLAHRTYDYKSLSQTQSALSAGAGVACGTPCDHAGVVKHWLWQYDMHQEDFQGTQVGQGWSDFHTVGGPTAGDPLAKDSDEYFSKNGKRNVYGPGTAPSFKPAAKEQARLNAPAETLLTDSAGKPVYVVRSNFTESCYCLPCPR